MERLVKVVSIDEEFEKGFLKRIFTRTRKGKMETVHPSAKERKRTRRGKIETVQRPNARERRRERRIT